MDVTVGSLFPLDILFLKGLIFFNRGGRPTAESLVVLDICDEVKGGGKFVGDVA